ncbi:hypothetical protein [Celerinatantimonas sp. YJH-8]|uniref:hypothetical protein n=1 Tax=Celerinatantimonas sp. YJH-8 TaxID=3228714 RepID=UPI0038BF7F79
MNTYQFDLILSGLRQATDKDLENLGGELRSKGCLDPNPRMDKYGIRVSVKVDADTFTRAIYLSTQYITSIQGYRLSVRSVEFN